MNVRFARETYDSLEELVAVLFQKEYFSWLNTSEQYVRELVDDIQSSLPKRPHKRAPERFARYGEDLHYASFVKNKRTTWYAFFTKYENESKDTIYLVRYIANNHTVAQHL